jgi:hypothetical protein
VKQEEEEEEEEESNESRTPRRIHNAYGSTPSLTHREDQGQTSQRKANRS